MWMVLSHAGVFLCKCKTVGSQILKKFSLTVFQAVPRFKAFFTWVLKKILASLFSD